MSIYVWCNSLFGTKICSFDIRSEIDPFHRFEQKVDEGYPPPDKQPNDEEIFLVEPAEKVYIPDLDLHDLGYLCATKIPAE